MQICKKCLAAIVRMAKRCAQAIKNVRSRLAKKEAENIDALPATSVPWVLPEKTGKKKLVYLIFACFALGLSLLLTLPALLGEQKEDGIFVYVASTDLAVSHTFSDESITNVFFPKRLLPEGTLPLKKDILGNKLANPLQKGEIVTIHDLVAGKIDPNSLKGKLQDGSVAFVFPESWTEAPLVNFEKGDFIDIIASYSKTDIRKTVNIVGQVEVLDVQEKTGAYGKVLVLKLSNDQARNILFARSTRAQMQVLLKAKTSK